jgi:hypothetical protein
MSPCLSARIADTVEKSIAGGTAAGADGASCRKYVPTEQAKPTNKYVGKAKWVF